MIGGAADHGVDIFLIEALPPVHVGLGVGKPLGPESQVFFVDVAEGHDVLAGDGAKVGFTASPGADQGDVELVAWRVGSEQGRVGEDEPGGAGEGSRFEELTSFHCGLSVRLRTRSYSGDARLCHVLV